MTRLIGYRWKCSDVWSRVVLITRKLPSILQTLEALSTRSDPSLGICATPSDVNNKRAKGGKRSSSFKELPVAIARGFHLFPFRTEKLSPSALMVLPFVGGRVSRCRLPITQTSPSPRKGAGLLCFYPYLTLLSHSSLSNLTSTFTRLSPDKATFWSLSIEILPAGRYRSHCRVVAIGVEIAFWICTSLI